MDRQAGSFDGFPNRLLEIPSGSPKGSARQQRTAAIEKETPQPQVEAALGLRMVKYDPISSSAK